MQILGTQLLWVCHWLVWKIIICLEQQQADSKRIIIIL